MVPRGRLFWKLLIGHAALALATLTVALFIQNRRVHELYVRNVEQTHRELTAALAGVVQDRLDERHADELQRIAERFARAHTEGLMRATFILPDGAVIADSHAEPHTMDAQTDSPEIVAARTHGIGVAVRWSNTIARTMRYTALRIGPAERPTGFVRIATPQEEWTAALSDLGTLAWKIGLPLGLISVAAAWFLASRWNRRVYMLETAARNLSRGVVTKNVELPGRDELALLARTLNRTARRFRRRLAASEQGRKTLESILNRLSEGIVVTEPEGRIILMNEAARRMFGLDAPAKASGTPPNGRTVEQCIPNHRLQSLLLNPLGEHGKSETEDIEIRLQIPGMPEERTVLARVAPVQLVEPEPQPRRSQPLPPDAEPIEPPRTTGRLLVLTDITELTRNVRMKSDFVAHASHQLRTPLTAIRGAVETLMGMNLGGPDALASRFLDIIARHSRRLEELAADLLTLSRLESGGYAFAGETVDLDDFLADLEQRWGEAARTADLKWTLEPPRDRRPIVAGRRLLELILDNLIDNAIKFTPPGGSINVTMSRENGAFVIRVSDTGCGIPEPDQPRVFERFYQAAAPRRGDTGVRVTPRGTGLGLAIVRHAVAAMKGVVELESAINRGTTVTVRLPQPPAEDGAPGG